MVDCIEDCQDVEAHQCDDGAFISVADNVIQDLVSSRLCGVFLLVGGLKKAEIRDWKIIGFSLVKARRSMIFKILWIDW